MVEFADGVSIRKKKGSKDPQIVPSSAEEGNNHRRAAQNECPQQREIEHPHEPIEATRAGGVVAQMPQVLDAIFDTSNGELQIRSLSAGLLDGQLRATGVLWTGAKHGHSEVKLELIDANSRRVGDAFGGRLPRVPGLTAAVQQQDGASGVGGHHLVAADRYAIDRERAHRAVCHKRLRFDRPQASPDSISTTA